MMTLNERAEVMYQSLLLFAQERGVKIVRKKDSKLIQFITIFAFWIPNFERFSHSIRDTGYLAEWCYDPSLRLATVATLSHELGHVWDYRHQGFFKFYFGYYFPQILAVFSLLAFLAFLSPWFLFFLLFLLCLLPLPSPGRRDAELLGYSLSEAIPYWAGVKPAPDLSTRLKSFKGISYYFMWPFEKSLRPKFKEWEQLILSGQLKTKVAWAAGIESIVKSV